MTEVSSLKQKLTKYESKSWPKSLTFISSSLCANSVSYEWEILIGFDYNVVARYDHINQLQFSSIAENFGSKWCSLFEIILMNDWFFFCLLVFYNLKTNFWNLINSIFRSSIHFSQIRDQRWLIAKSAKNNLIFNFKLFNPTFRQTLYKKKFEICLFSRDFSPQMTSVCLWWPFMTS